MPAGWEEAPRGEMRRASFKIAGENGKLADVSVIQLPGIAGGDINNVNRWRGQVGLSPVSENELAKLAEKVSVGGLDGTLFDLSGTAASGDTTRVLAAILHRKDAVWFLKMTGDDELGVKQKPAFIDFLKSLKFAAATEIQATLPTNLPPFGEAAPTLPTGHPSIGAAMPAMAAATDNSPKPQWETPGTWKEEPTTQMLLAKFSVSDKDARADITVSSFPGDVGGLLANVNRWRRQVNLPAFGEAQLSSSTKNLKVQSENGTLVELENSDGKSPSLIGVSLPHNGQTWFFKMIGDAKVVAREKDAFIKFVQNVKLPNVN
jgi:hypothetical protein